MKKALAVVVFFLVWPFLLVENVLALIWRLYEAGLQFVDRELFS